MTLEGEQKYDAKIMELMARLEARGILLVVLQGNRNDKDVEWGSALRKEDIPLAIQTLARILMEMKQDWEGIAGSPE